MQEQSSVNLLIKQGRKCNRKLFKGDISHIKKTAHRIIQGFRRSDKGTKIHTNANVKGITLLERSNTFVAETMRRDTFLSVMKNGVPVTLAPNEGV
jgi:hypothetical protein